MKLTFGTLKHAHYVTLEVRINGETRRYQADWLKTVPGLEAFLTAKSVDTRQGGSEGAPEGSGDVRVLAEQQARAARLFSQGRDQERISAVARALAREASTWEVAATDTVWRHLALAALATDAAYRASLASRAASTGEKP